MARALGPRNRTSSLVGLVPSVALPGDERLPPGVDAVGQRGATNTALSPVDRRGNPGRWTWRFLSLAEIANFPALRRRLGRERADRLVMDVRSRISAAMPSARVATIGRSLLEMSFRGHALAELEVALESLQTAFNQSIEVDGEHCKFEMLFAGAADALEGMEDMEDVRLAEEAEGALEQARGEKKLVVRDLSAGTPAFDRLTLSRELSPALAKREMFLQYQPKVNVRRQEVAAAEALVRWQHPVRGLVLPGDFIQLAEEIGEIGPLTLWTLDQVIEDQKRLAADGYDLTVFINISGQLLADTAFVAAACRKVCDGGAKIGFEITETSVIRDPESAIRHLQLFADVGITIAIDDYGAGLSSLAYLKQLPARELKIDKMFVLHLTSSHRDPLIVRSTIDLAHALEMEVTAEGVETQAAMALLAVMGCDMVQGYLISRPLSFEGFREYLTHDRLKPIEDQRASLFTRPDSFWKSA
jgi:EAL domain-containing protein (putative c-di-GMP-specific phosphodiesterase class I)